MGSLSGRKVIVTRARHQAGEFVRLLESRGAAAVAIPTIDIALPDSWEAVDKAIGTLADYDWIVLTSVNGATGFLRRLRERTGSIEAAGGCRICAVGPKTRAAVEAEGLEVAFMPTRHVAEAVVEEAPPGSWEGKKILFPRAAEGRDVIPVGLRAKGATVDLVPVYRTVSPDSSREAFARVLSEGADAITFSSGSTVKNFAALFPGGEAKRILNGVAVACIGPITADEAKKNGIPVDVMPDTYTIPALTEALGVYFEAGRE
jgi:uroporphyrinogen III methyltransferase/synthase